MHISKVSRQHVAFRSAESGESPILTVIWDTGYVITKDPSGKLLHPGLDSLELRVGHFWLSIFFHIDLCPPPKGLM